MGNSDLILNIQSIYNQFTKAEKKVADYIINNQKEVLYMSITDLADECRVGDTSVYRFCRSMGLQGYQEFKMKLSLSLPEGNEEEKMKSNEDLNEHFDMLAQKILQKHASALRATYRLLNQEEFYRMLSMFDKAKNIFFFGVGDSLQSALDARNKFIRITNKVRCITDTHIQAMAASMFSPEDLLFIFSYSGATKDNVQLAKIAKENGAKIVGITRYKKSPLTIYADAVLLCGADESPLEGGSTSVKISQHYIIDLLYTEYYNRNYNMSKKNRKKTSKSVVEKLL